MSDISDDHSSGPSTSANKPSNKQIKRKKYAQNYKREWEALPQFRGWLNPSRKTSQKSLSTKNSAYCQCCDKEINISSGVDALSKHASTQSHKQNAKIVSIQPKISAFVNHGVHELGNQVKEGIIIFKH